MSEPVDVIAIGAHPDDAEIGCGGVLALASEAGLRVAVADLTAGELSTKGTPEQREKERLRAGEVLGLCERRCLDLGDTRLGEDDGQVAAIAALIREVRPRIVLAPHPEDRHPDHVAAGRIVRQACFVAGVAKWGTGAAHRPSYLFHYMLHYPFEPSFVVDISSAWDRKMESIMAYESQFDAQPGLGANSPDFPAFLAARATFHGAMIGVDRGEPFSCPGPVPLKTLPGLDAASDGNPSGYRMFL